MFKSIGEPDYRTRRSLATPSMARMLICVIGRIKSALITRFRDSDMTWDAASIGAARHDEIAKLDIKAKAVMTVAGCQLTGMKVRSVALQRARVSFILRRLVRLSRILCKCSERTGRWTVS